MNPFQGGMGASQVVTGTGAHLFNNPPVQADCYAPQVKWLVTSMHKCYPWWDLVQIVMNKLEDNAGILSPTVLLV